MGQENKEQMHKSDRPYVAREEQMSKQMDQAWIYLNEATDSATDTAGQLRLQRMSSRLVLRILDQLEERMAELEEQMSLSETPSSEATETPEEIPPTSTISSTWSSHANLDGYLPLSVHGAILDWLSSQQPLGPNQEVVIGLTLTPKGETSQSGSASQSTKEPIHEGNGAHGEVVDADDSAKLALMAKAWEELHERAIFMPPEWEDSPWDRVYGHAMRQVAAWMDRYSKEWDARDG